MDLHERLDSKHIIMWINLSCNSYSNSHLGPVTTHMFSNKNNKSKFHYHLTTTGSFKFKSNVDSCIIIQLSRVSKNIYISFSEEIDLSYLALLGYKVTLELETQYVCRCAYIQTVWFDTWKTYVIFNSICCWVL